MIRRPHKSFVHAQHAGSQTHHRASIACQHDAINAPQSVLAQDAQKRVRIARARYVSGHVRRTDAGRTNWHCMRYDVIGDATQ